jgi:hypothetical protein
MGTASYKYVRVGKKLKGKTEPRSKPSDVQYTDGCGVSSSCRGSLIVFNNVSKLGAMSPSLLNLFLQGPGDE